jgi:Flp pilus assembly protein TadD
MLDAADPSIAPAVSAPAERSDLPPVGSAPAPVAMATGTGSAADEGGASLKPETLAAIRDARSVRDAGNKARALAMLDKTPDADKDHALLLERGLLSLELGQVERATELLKQAHDSQAPDWRQHSALGAALSAQGQQQAAQAELAKALALAPDNPAVLNNLALSYALDGKHTEAEKLLRTASTHASTGGPQARQNLALILGLRGNIAEARALSEGVLPPKQAKSNIAYLEQLKSGGTQVSKAEPLPQDDAREAVASVKPESDAPIMNLGGPQ